MISSIILQVWGWTLIIAQIVLLTMQMTGYISWPVWKYLAPGILFVYNIVFGASCICCNAAKEKEKGKPK